MEELNLTEDGKDKAVDTSNEAKHDWSLLDTLINHFMQTEPDEMLSVLCGYF